MKGQNMNLIGKIACALPKWLGGGHRRGKRHGEAPAKTPGTLRVTYRCPRCSALHERHVKVTTGEHP